MIDRFFGIQQIDATDHFINGPETEFGHVLANLLRDEEEEIDDMLRLA